MENLARALLELDWKDMDDFAHRIREIAVDDDGGPNDERYIAGSLIDWAAEIRTNSQV